jgi:F0F1-type ATP synthase assembly protein I
MADDGPRKGTGDGLRGRDLASLGGMVAGSVIGFMVVGILLDRVAGSTPAFTLVGLALGVVGGCVGFWLRVRAALRDPGSS